MENGLLAAVFVALGQYISKNQFSPQVVAEITQRIADALSQPRLWINVVAQAETVAREASDDPAIRVALFNYLVLVEST